MVLEKSWNSKVVVNFTASTPSSRVIIYSPWYELHIIRCTAYLR